MIEIHHFTTFLPLFLALIFGHYLADYPLQGEFLAKAKNRNDPIPNIPWWHALTAHAFIHAGIVYMITGSAIAFAGEFITHFYIDDRKCRGELTFEEDQFLHLLCKMVWAIVAITF